MPPADGRVLVIADTLFVAEALAMALSASGLSARPALALPWHGNPGSASGSAALVVLGSGDRFVARRVVSALIGVGRRVALAADSQDDPVVAECMSVGAEVVIPLDSGLDHVAGVLGNLVGGRNPAPMHAGRPEVAPTAGDLDRERLISLTGRERQILEGLIAGRRPKQLARDHFVSLQTVRTQIRSMLRKLDVHSQVEAVALAFRVGWIPPSR